MRYRTYAEARQEVAGIGFSDHPRATYKSASEFASRARYYSPQRFRQEVRQLQENYLRRRRYYDLRRQGADYKTARRGSSSRSRFRETLDRVRREREIDEPIISDPETGYNKSKDERWSKWAENKDYPTYIEERVRRVNRANGYDPDAKWGWAVIYYEYVYGLNREWVVDNLQVFDRFGDFYRNMVQQTLT